MVLLLRPNLSRLISLRSAAAGSFSEFRSPLPPDVAEARSSGTGVVTRTAPGAAPAVAEYAPVELRPGPGSTRVIVAPGRGCDRPLARASCCACWLLRISCSSGVAVATTLPPGSVTIAMLTCRLFWREILAYPAPTVVGACCGCLVAVAGCSLVIWDPGGGRANPLPSLPDPSILLEWLAWLVSIVWVVTMTAPGLVAGVVRRIFPLLGL